MNEKKLAAHDLRKVVQIAAREEGVYALCDDGTIWFRRAGAGVWSPIDLTTMTKGENG